jgi:hypothetical protein
MNTRLGNTAGLISALLALFLAVFGALADSAHGATVAMVTDLQGKAGITREGRRYDATILAELVDGAQVRVDAGTTMSVLYLDTGDEYVFKGPVQILFRLGQPEIISGAQPEKRSLSLDKDGRGYRIKPVGVAQAALVMRGARIRLLNLHDTITLETRPEFRWEELQPGLKYQIEITDDAGRMLYSTQLDATSLPLPESLQLKDGLSYTWEVSVQLPDARKLANAGVFSLATAELRAQAAYLRPAASAPLSARISYAAWLEQMNLKDEARAYWQAAASERPEDLRLKALASQ